MPKYLSYLLLLLGLLPASALARNIVISGYISEKKSGERLIGAIIVEPSSGLGAATNSFGFYSLSLPEADSVQLRVSYIGFETQLVSTPARATTVLNISLSASVQLAEVTVKAQSDAIHDKVQMSSVDLPIATIKSLPAFLGEVDIMKAIQLLPGVQSGNEGASGLYVRGGSPDQNLILLDGVPVYNASHLFGFFSVFNADAVKSVSVIKGGFPARYGGRLSSVIDINMKEGNQNELHGEGGIGIVASRLTLEGPIKKGKSSFMVSGRRTYIDLLAQPLMSKSERGGYNFYDLNGKINFSLGKRDHVYISGYGGNDKFYAKTKYESTGSNSTSNASLIWGNITAVARWNHQYSSRLFGNLTAYYSQYRFQLSSEQQDRNIGSTDSYLLKYSSGINDKALRYDFDYAPTANHAIKAGVGYIAHTYKPSAQQTKFETGGTVPVDTTTGEPEINASEIDAYIEDEMRLGSRMKVNAGVHFAAFSVGQSTFTSFQPRVSMLYRISNRISAKASYVQMAQFIHLLTNSSIGLPTDLWLPATEKVKPQQSWQTAAGLAYTVGAGLELSLEGYYKAMDGVIEYKEGASFMGSSTGWESKVEIGQGTSYGLEVFAQKKKGKFTGMMGYTLSWTSRQFDALNGGKWFPYKYDRRHDFKIAGVFKVSNRIELSAEWLYGTGNALTIPIGTYVGPAGDELDLYGSRNGYRMQAYHRGDISARFSRKMRRHERSWIIGAYNVYNRHNPFFIYRDGNNFKQVSLFPIIPSITYQFKF
jgi:energy-converting hydrogenase Eha subunit B